MTVIRILHAGTRRKVETIAPGASVSDAISQLAARRIGALVVSETGTDVLGIISERDIIRHMGEGEDVGLTQPVRAVMTSPVETCRESDHLLDVLGRMTDGRFRHMPVVDNAGAMIGIVSIGDVVKARLDEIQAENQAMVEMLSG